MMHNEKVKLKTKLHAHIEGMSSEELRKFATEKFAELEKELLSHELTEENVTAHLLRVRVITETVIESMDTMLAKSEMKLSKSRSDAGWAAENARWEQERNRYNQWESMGS